MDRLEILKKAKEKVDALVAEKLRASEEESNDAEVTKMAVFMNSADAVISAIENSKLDIEEFGRIVAENTPTINVQVPPISVPPIQIPEIRVPEAKVTVNIPEIKLPTINVPEPKVTVNVPELKIPPFPEIKMPESMEVHGEVGLFGYGFNNPLPVQLRDAEGNPVSLPDMINVMSGGGSSRFVKINNSASEPIPITGNITASQGAIYYASDAVGSVNIVQSIPLNVSVSGATGTIGVVTINPDGNPVYGGTSSGGGLTDTELRASHIDVMQMSGTIDSVYVSGVAQSTYAELLNPDGRVKVELPTGTTGLTNTELRAQSLEVIQVSGASNSVNVLSIPSVTVTSITNSTAVSILNGDGTTLDPRNRTWTITETVPVSAPNTLDVQQVSGASWSTNVLSMPSVTVTSITNSTASALVDSGGVQYSGSNPVPVLPNFSSVTATTADASASGDNTIIAITNTPRLYYIALSANGANSADVTAIVKIGASSKFKVSLKAGAIWAHHIGASSQYLTGSAGDDIIVNLSANQTVHVSVEYADV